MITNKFNFGSSNYDEEIDKVFRVSNGEAISQKDANDLWKFSWKIIDDTDKMSKISQSSLGKYFKDSYNALNEDEHFTNVSKELKAQMVDLIHKAAKGLFATHSWDDVSAKLTGTLYGETEGDQYNTWRTEGFKTVFEFINVSWLIFKSNYIFEISNLVEKTTKSI